MSQLALSDSFEYLCYGSTAIRNMLTLTVLGSTLDVSAKRWPRAVAFMASNSSAEPAFKQRWTGV